MTVAILIPVLDRPHRVMPLVASIKAATPQPHRILFICDPGDTETQDQIALAGAGMMSPGGNYAHKINTAAATCNEPLLFLGADDLHFYPDWLPNATGHMQDGIEVVGVNDLCSARVQAGRHATHFLITNHYATRPTIDGGRGPLCEAYIHNYVDDELVGTARKRKTIAFATNSVVQHLHPDAGLAPWDDIYRKGRSAMLHDQAIYRHRLKLWR